MNTEFIAPSFKQLITCLDQALHATQAVSVHWVRYPVRIGGYWHCEIKN